MMTQLTFLAAFAAMILVPPGASDAEDTATGNGKGKTSTSGYVEANGIDWMREHMSQNRLAILPDLTHYEIFMAPSMARAARRFLDGESGGPIWAEQVESRQEAE